MYILLFDILSILFYFIMVSFINELLLSST